MKYWMTIAVLVIGVVCMAAMTPADKPSMVAGVLQNSETVAVADAANYVEVARIQAEGRAVLLQVTIGSGGAIAHLKVSQSVVQGGTLNTLAEDADFASPTVALPYVLGSAVHQTAAGGSFQVKLDSGAADYVVYAKKAAADTTVKVTGRVL